MVIYGNTITTWRLTGQLPVLQPENDRIQYSCVKIPLTQADQPDRPHCLFSLFFLFLF